MINSATTLLRKWFFGFRPCQGLFSRGSWLPVTEGLRVLSKSFLVLTMYLQRCGWVQTTNGIRAIRPRRRQPKQNTLVSHSAGFCVLSTAVPCQYTVLGLIRCFIVREPETRLESLGSQVFWKPRIQLMRPFGRGRNTNENHTTK